MTISYDGSSEEGDYSNERLWTQYGFILDDHLITTKDADLIPWNYLTAHEIEREEKGGSVVGSGVRKHKITQAVLDGLIDALVDSVTHLKFNAGEGEEGYAKGSVLEQVICALRDRITSSILVDNDDGGSEMEFGSAKETLLQIQQTKQIYSSSHNTGPGYTALHVLNENSHVDWVSPKGEPAAEGTCGEKVYNRVQYLAVVRYRMDRKKALNVCISVLDVALSKV